MPPPRAMASEACSQLWLAAPITLSNLLERTQYWVTLTLVGLLGPDYLGPVALASSVNNVLGTSVAIGLSMATATLSSQAAGARDAKALSLVLQRAIPINLVFSLPCMLLLLTLRPILVGGLQMDEEFGARAGVYGLTVLPVAALTGILRCQQVWLVSQGRPRPAMFVQLGMTPVHALLSFVLVRNSPLGYAGAGVAMSLSMLARVGALHAYIATSAHTRTHWGGFSRSALSGWGSYLALALPGVAMLSEYWIGEIIMLAAARLPSPQVALSALSLYQLVNTTCYQPVRAAKLPRAPARPCLLPAMPIVLLPRAWRSSKPASPSSLTWPCLAACARVPAKRHSHGGQRTRRQLPRGGAAAACALGLSSWSAPRRCLAARARHALVLARC